MPQDESDPAGERKSLINKLLWFCLTNKLVVGLVVLGVIGWGIMVAPFDWPLEWFPRDPVPVDAIPDIGENQQIVFTRWPGRSPQDVDLQITYPLTSSLMGVRGVKSVRSFSMMGFSSIYVIFDESMDFNESRWSLLEKLNSLPADTLPEGVWPALGPDATALGQVFWYTLEGRDPAGKPVGGWDLNELRTIQDWNVRYALLSAEGVAEVASIGGFVQEYQIDVDPDAMQSYGVALNEVFMAVKMSNVDVGARTIEVNNVEYVIRGLGFIENLDDIRYSVVKVNENVPIYIKDVAHVTLGPASRRGALDKGGAEAVGSVVVVRYGENPLAVIQNVKNKIKEIAPGLDKKAVVDYGKVTQEQIESFGAEQGFEAFLGVELNQEAWLEWLRDTLREDWPEWVTTSQVTIVPFYDRTGLIYETLGTLGSALREEILVTIIVVLVMVMHLRSSALISGLLPLAVLMCFIGMKVFGVDANIVALSGIAIAIGTMVDMGIVVCENILRHLDTSPAGANRLEVIYRAASEVGSAVLTAVATTVISFLPVFTMVAAEGKLFKPLAFTKTFALIASVIVALTIIPPAAHLLFGRGGRSKIIRYLWGGVLILLGVAAGIWIAWWAGVLIGLFGVYYFIKSVVPGRVEKVVPWIANLLIVALVGLLLTGNWMPLGPDKGLVRNLILVGVMLGGILLLVKLFQWIYAPLLGWCLRHKIIFVCLPMALVVCGVVIWSGLGKEFMPPLDEGSFLYMPTTMTHASMGESLDILARLDLAIGSVPEVDQVVGKLGRVESPLDPAPISMFEIVINYKPEYITDKGGRRVRFRYDSAAGEFVRRADGELIKDERGRPYRQWREHIRSADDIWDEIVKVGRIPGTTSAPKLQPIKTRLIMLQSGMRAPMGVKVRGPKLETIERVGLEIERLLKEVPSVKAEAVIADRIVGKPYIEIKIDRRAIDRYQSQGHGGLTVRDVQDVIEIGLGGRRITTTVEGLERYAVRVRYQRELRSQIEDLDRILVPTAGGAQIPLVELSEVRYITGPQVVKREDTFQVGYVLFDSKSGYAEVDVVEQCEEYLKAKIKSGELALPDGVSYSFAGNYENQVRSAKTLMVVLPFALFLIFIILYFQFKSVATTLLVFSGIFVAWAGGFMMIWLYGQGWFMNFSVFGVNMRDMFQIHPLNLSVAVWVGFLALFGIASDNGVIVATYLKQTFAAKAPAGIEGIRQATVEGAVRRVRPALMTTATTILALLPVLTSTGRGSDVMVPMAIPSFGGMSVAVITLLVVPVLYCWIKEISFRIGSGHKDAAA